MKKLFLLIIFVLPFSALASSYEGVKLQKPYVQLHDKASLQRGAKYFMRNCQSCHSLEFMRYDQLARGIGMVDENGDVDEEAVQKALIFTGAKITDPIVSSMPKAQAEQAFGVQPPDLSLVARSRGNSWLYTYFRSYYADPERPSGSNNLIFPDTAMPNLFEPIQGRQEPIIKKQTVVMDGVPQTINVITDLKLVRKGSMSTHEFNQLTTDLVAFLDYVGEPTKLKRYRLGTWILLFLSLFVIVAYLLKREFWRDVH